MQLNLSAYEKVNTILGELSLYWRVYKISTAVMCSPQSNDHSGLLEYIVQPRFSQVLFATPKWRQAFRLNRMVPVAKISQFSSLSKRRIARWLQLGPPITNTVIFNGSVRCVN